MSSVADARLDEVLAEEADATTAQVGRQWKRAKLAGDLAGVYVFGITDEDTCGRVENLMRKASLKSLVVDVEVVTRVNLRSAL